MGEGEKEYKEGEEEKEQEVQEPLKGSWGMWKKRQGSQK